jgi:hypothetical protein
MKAFLQRFALLVSGVLQGFDRLVFKGRLQRLYRPEGMHTLLGLNGVQCSDFKTYAAGVTTKVLVSWFSLIWKNRLFELAVKG